MSVDFDRKADLELAELAADALIERGKISPRDHVLVRRLMREFASEQITGDEFEEAMAQIVDPPAEPVLDPGVIAEITTARELAKFWVRRIGWCLVLTALVVGVTMRFWRRR